MVKALEELSTVEQVLFGFLVVLAILLTGYIADLILGRAGFGTIANGVLIVGGCLCGALVRLNLLGYPYS